MGYVFPPPTQCPASLPYALFADIPLQSSIQIGPPVSGLNVRNASLDGSITRAAKIRPGS